MAETPPQEAKDLQNLDETRNPDGTFKPGHSGNPTGAGGGRPPGHSIMAIVRQKMSEIPLGQVKAWKEQLADTIIELAVVHKSEAMLKLVTNYMDGMPTTKLAIDTDDKESIEALTSFFRLVGNTPKPVQETTPVPEVNETNGTPDTGGSTGV